MKKEKTIFEIILYIIFIYIFDMNSINKIIKKTFELYDFYNVKAFEIYGCFVFN